MYSGSPASSSLNRYPLFLRCSASLPGFFVCPAGGEGAADGQMEDGEGRSGSSSGGAASQASVQPSREGQAHPAAAAASRGQCGLKLLTHGFRRGEPCSSHQVESQSRVLSFSSDLCTYSNQWWQSHFLPQGSELNPSELLLIAASARAELPLHPHLSPHSPEPTDIHSPGTQETQTGRETGGKRERQTDRETKRQADRERQPHTFMKEWTEKIEMKRWM